MIKNCVSYRPTVLVLHFPGFLPCRMKYVRVWAYPMSVTTFLILLVRHYIPLSNLQAGSFVSSNDNAAWYSEALSPQQLTKVKCLETKGKAVSQLQSALPLCWDNPFLIISSEHHHSHSQTWSQQHLTLTVHTWVSRSPRNLNSPRGMVYMAWKVCRIAFKRDMNPNIWYRDYWEN